MGGAETEIDDRDHRCAARDGLVPAHRIAKTPVGCACGRGVARFEKGTDPEVIDLAHRRFAALVAPAGARLEAGTVDVRGELPDRAPVRVRTGRLNRLLGTTLGAGEIAELLAPIGYDAAVTGEDTVVSIPSWRYDSTSEIDVVEEVARLYGYTNIGVGLPPSPHAGRLTERQLERRRLRALLVGRGLSEALPLPFLAPGDLERSGLIGDGITIANPLVAEESVLRTSLLPGLVKALATNAARRNAGVALWEIGHVFRRPVGADSALPDEREMLGVALCRGDAAAAVHEGVRSETAGGARHRRAHRPVPGLQPDPLGRAGGSVRRAGGAVGESTRRCSRLWHPGAGGVLRSTWTGRRRPP